MSREVPCAVLVSYSALSAEAQLGLVTEYRVIGTTEGKERNKQSYDSFFAVCPPEIFRCNGGAESALVGCWMTVPLNGAVGCTDPDSMQHAILTRRAASSASAPSFLIGFRDCTTRCRTCRLQ